MTEQTQSSQQAKPNIKLYYFNGRGRCEHIRYMLAMRPLPYEDVRIEFDQWPEMKKTMPFGSLPVLERDGKKYGQSIAIARIVAKHLDLYASSIEEMGEIDSIVEALTEIREAGLTLGGKDEEEKAKNKESFIKTKIPTILGQLSALLGEKEYFVGDKITWADIHFYAIMELVELTLKIPGILEMEKCEKLKKHFEKIHNIPAIAGWREKRPETSF